MMDSPEHSLAPRPSTPFSAKRTAVGASMLVALLVLTTAHAQGGRRPRRPPAATPPPGIDVPSCVEVRPESRQNGIGFSHAVIVTNRCAFAVQCDLATDADPSPTYPLRVEPSATGEVVTRIVSPAPGIRALARCSPVATR